MSEYTNIIDIYETLYKMSDVMPPEMQDGFDEAVYLLQRELKKLSSINLHLENNRLNKALKRAQKEVDELPALFTDKIAKMQYQISGHIEDKNHLRGQIAGLLAKNERLTIRLNQAQSPVTKFNKKYS